MVAVYGVFAYICMCVSLGVCVCIHVCVCVGRWQCMHALLAILQNKEVGYTGDWLIRGEHQRLKFQTSLLTFPSLQQLLYNLHLWQKINIQTISTLQAARICLHCPAPAFNQLQDPGIMSSLFIISHKLTKGTWDKTVFQSFNHLLQKPGHFFSFIEGCMLAKRYGRETASVKWPSAQ